MSILNDAQADEHLQASGLSLGLLLGPLASCQCQQCTVLQQVITLVLWQG